MIKEWRLRDFKSVALIQPLIFKKLTIFAGPNSSGKSTVLQSILLTSQTLGSKVTNRHLVLNGELVRLGTFEDVVHEKSKTSTIEVGFTFELDADHIRAVASSNRYLLFARAGMVHEAAGFEFSLDLEFGIPSVAEAASPRQLQPELMRGDFSATRKPSLMYREGSQTRRSSTLQLSLRPPAEVETFVKSMNAQPEVARGVVDPNDFRFQVKVNPGDVVARRRYRRFAAFGPKYKSDCVAVGLEHFLPTSLVLEFPQGPRFIESFLEMLLENSPNEIQKTLAYWEGGGSNSVSQAIARSFKSIADQKGLELTELARKMRSVFTGAGGGEEQDTIRRIEADVSRQVDPEMFQRPAFEYAAPPDDIAMLDTAVTAMFSSVRYLGPLRDEPRVVYGIANTADPTDVGPKGQYTAAVLDLYGTKEVIFVPPSNPDSPPIKASLNDAVKAWISHFGLAESFRTTEEGKLGHRLLIKQTGIERDVDLTNVGVGVSQVLPIIVMSLISDPGSVLLFEQPEFHVHPKVQSLLADFFLSMIRSGRQCVIETHSEYLINRLRLRVARSPLEDALHRDIMVFFVERHGASSVFQTIPMNEFGAIPDWPEGFFDQGPDEAEQILQAARVKRRIFDEFQMRRKRQDVD